ncbi:MAG: succinate dehydrogenase assembly factor 2 [Arsenophonus sp.]
MNIHNKHKIYWACRRGIRELEIFIIFFFKYEYDSLTKNEKYLFVRLLECTDIDLLDWLTNSKRPDNDDFYNMIQLIKNKNNQRNFLKKNTNLFN